MTATAGPGVSDALFTLDPTREYPVLDRADDVYVWDTDGRRYLDAIAGIGVANIGYGRDEVVEAIAEQAARLPFAVGNIFANEPAMRLADAIAGFVRAAISGNKEMERLLRKGEQGEYIRVL